MKTFIIGIGGGSGSGKTTIAEAIAKKLNATIISTDNYYYDLSHLPMSVRDDANYDHPDSIEWALLAEHMKILSEGKSIDMPQYVFGPHIRKEETVKIHPSEYIIVEGILALHDKKLNSTYNYKIFVDMPEEIRLKRRIERDINERDATEEITMRMWNNHVRPMQEKFVEPSKNSADIIINNNPEEIKKIVETIIKLKKNFS